MKFKIISMKPLGMKKIRVDYEYVNFDRADARRPNVKVGLEIEWAILYPDGRAADTGIAVWYEGMIFDYGHPSMKTEDEDIQLTPWANSDLRIKMLQKVDNHLKKIRKP